MENILLSKLKQKALYGILLIGALFLLTFTTSFAAATTSVTYDMFFMDLDGDGVPDVTDIDDDGDGITDANEDANEDGDNDPATMPTDSDNDGLPNYLDTDSDNDGISDNTEAQSPLVFISRSGTDADGNGLDDAYEVCLLYTSPSPRD